MLYEDFEPRIMRRLLASFVAERVPMDHSSDLVGVFGMDLDFCFGCSFGLDLDFGFDF